MLWENWFSDLDMIIAILEQEAPGWLTKTSGKHMNKIMYPINGLVSTKTVNVSSPEWELP